ncbi:MAG TPA: hypothetical protein VFF11_00265, partial [Candidatus Binatia bacterium]|nr:hypothetical protein [Candidatus Binatia bacterium]
MKTRPCIEEDASMSQDENSGGKTAPIEEIQRDWHDITLRVQQLETERDALEHENKALRSLVERVIEHRQKSHGELVNLLATLVSRLPINDIGVIVARLVEHNAHVTEVSASLAKGKMEENMLQPAILKQLDKTKRDLLAAIQPAVEELIQLDAPFEPGMLQSLIEQPDNFFSPAFSRANRGFVKGQLPQERIIKEFGQGALVFFKDVTTDVKFNPRPKPEEIMLVFKPDFAELLAQNPDAVGTKRAEFEALHKKVQQSKESTDQARAQKGAFLRLSFYLELLHYYENQSTESPDVVFAQRMPPLIEQLVITGDGDKLDEKLMTAAEKMLGHIISTDHRKAVINNIGKPGGLARTLRYTLAFRMEELSDIDPITLECIKHLIPQEKAPSPQSLATVLRLFNPHMQKSCIRAITVTDRLRKEEAENLGKAVAKELGLDDVVNRISEQTTISPEKEREHAWNHIKDLIASRAAPNEIIAAVRKRMHGNYDADEVKACWLALTDTDPMVFVRVFCLFPYLADG